MITIEEARKDPVYHAIPPAVLQSLYNYIERHQRPGGFVRAVLENDLRRAFQNADSESMRNLGAIVQFVYNAFPCAAYGSWKDVENWIQQVPVRPADQALPNPNQVLHPHFDIHGFPS